MVKSRYGAGGGLRDNRRWGADGSGKQDGYVMYSDNATIEAAMGLNNGGQADKWAGKLTPWEEWAVHWYTGHGHRLVNEYERLNKHDKLSSDEYAQLTSNLSSALAKGSVNKRMIVNRTSSADMFGGAHTVSDLRKLYGQTFTDKGFMSTEVNLGNSLANPYGSKHGSEQLFMHIKVPTGKGIGQYIRGMSGAHREQEFLFDKRSHFTVLGAYEDAQGRVHVNLKYAGKGGRAKKI